MPHPSFLPRAVSGGAALVLVIVLALAATASTALAAGQVGEPAAGFNLESLDGGFIALGDHAGEVVVLHVIGYG